MDERKVNVRVYLVRDFMFFGVQTDLEAHTGAKKFKWEQFCFEIMQPFRISPIKTGKHQLCFFLFSIIILKIWQDYGLLILFGPLKKYNLLPNKL